MHSIDSLVCRELMKFGCTITQPVILYNIGASLEKLDKSWILSLDHENLSITAVSSTNVTRKVNVYATIVVESLFVDYVIESKNSNRIWLELCGEHFVRALKSGQNAVDLKIKLAKKDLPVLSLIITNQSRSGKLINLVQDVPVRVLNWDMVKDLGPPKLSVHELKLKLPPLDSLKKLIDKMSHLDTKMILRGDNLGNLEFKLSNDELTVKTEFACSNVVAGNPIYSEIQVDIRDFSKIMGLSSIHPTAVDCYIYRDLGLVIQGFVAGGLGQDRKAVSISFHISQID